MRNAGSLEIYAYWQAVRGNRDAPLRAQIDPSQIRSILPDLFMLKEQDGRLRFGLTGTRLYNLFQKELGGTDFACIWNAELTDYACAVASGVIEHRLPVMFDLRAETDDRVENMTMEMLLLPLAFEPNLPRRILGFVSCHPARGDFSRALMPLLITRSTVLDTRQTHEPGEKSSFYASARSK